MQVVVWPPGTMPVSEYWRARAFLEIAQRVGMPASEVMHKFKKGKLHSGSKKGPKVKNRKQAIAIMLSEKRQERKGKLK